MALKPAHSVGSQDTAAETVANDTPMLPLAVTNAMLSDTIDPLAPMLLLLAPSAKAIINQKHAASFAIST